MIVLGIDPGTARLGFGVVDSTDSQRPKALEFGVFATEAGEDMPSRLLRLYEQLLDLMERLTPSVLAVEQLFFSRNVTTAITVGQARGIVLLAAAKSGVPVVEYSPSEIKQAVVGYGKADKPQMQEMVRIVLGLSTTPQPDDAADALAIALCHAQTAPFLAKTAAG